MLVHEGGWRMERDGARWRCFRPDGSELAATLAHGGDDPVGDLCQAHGIGVNPDTLTPTWDGSPVDFRWAASALRAMDSPAH